MESLIFALNFLFTLIISRYSTQYRDDFLYKGSARTTGMIPECTTIPLLIFCTVHGTPAVICPSKQIMSPAWLRLELSAWCSINIPLGSPVVPHIIIA